MSGRTAAIALTVLLALGAVVLELGALLVLGMNCDESCGATAAWRDDPDAWQWKFQLGWATVGFVLVAASLPLVIDRQYRAAIGAVTAGVVVFATWAAFLAH